MENEDIMSFDFKADYSLSTFEIDHIHFAETSDIVIIVDENEIEANRSILSLFFDYFEKLFIYKDENERVCILDVPLVTSISAEILFEYLRKFKLMKDEISPQIGFEILIFLDFCGVKRDVEKYLSPLKKTITSVMNRGVRDEEFIEYLRSFDISDVVYFLDMIPKELFEQEIRNK